MSHPIRILEDAEQIAGEAAQEFWGAVEEGIRGRSAPTVVLSGGSTPRTLYTLLASEPYRKRLPWSRIHFFFGDERHVPPEDPQSNYRMVHEAMLSRVPVPPENVHRIRAEEPDASRVAAAYEAELRQHFSLAPEEFPQFDLALLGLGPDGHTASLFPGTEALHETRCLAAANWVGRLGSHRITLTVLVFNSAALVVFLVAGKEGDDLEVGSGGALRARAAPGAAHPSGARAAGVAGGPRRGGAAFHRRGVPLSVPSQ